MERKRLAGRAVGRGSRSGGVGQLPQGNGEGLRQGRLTVPTSVLSEGTGHAGAWQRGFGHPLCARSSL